MYAFVLFAIALIAIIPATLAQGWGGGGHRHRVASTTTTTSPVPAEDTSTPATSGTPSSPPPSTGGAHKGFNYGAATNNAGTDFATEFAAAQKLSGTSGFNSARLYTMIEYGTTDTPSSAFQAAINTGTTLLLGIWCSGGQTIVTNELNALAAAVKQYPDLNSLVVGISVGSEDLYRNPSGAGASATTILSYISQTRSAMSAAGVTWPLGHVDTANIWQGSDGQSVIGKIDWIGADVYPYYSSGSPSSLSDFTSGMAVIPDSKPVWVTETGWPTSGTFASTSSVSGTGNAQTYWKTVGCGHLFGATNTWWYTFYDGNVALPFGVSPSVGGTSPKYSLAC